MADIIRRDTVYLTYNDEGLPTLWDQPVGDAVPATWVETADGTITVTTTEPYVRVGVVA